MPFFAEAQSSSIAATTEISAANIVPTDAIPPDASNVRLEPGRLVSFQQQPHNSSKKIVLNVYDNMIYSIWIKFITT